MGKCACGKETTWNDMCEDCLFEWESKVYACEKEKTKMTDFERYVFDRLSGIPRDYMTQSEKQISSRMVDSELCVWESSHGETYLKRPI